MHAGFTSIYLHCRTEFLRDAIYQQAPSFSIKQTHPSNMALEMSLANEFCHNILMEGRWSQIHSMSSLQEVLNQIFGNNEVAETQRRK